MSASNIWLQYTEKRKACLLLLYRPWLPFFFNFNLDTASDGFWHWLCADWIFLPLSFSIYESFSRQTHFLTLETKWCDKAISLGFWCKIPARRTWQRALRPKISANKIHAGHRWTNSCPGDVTSESLTIRDIQALEGAQEEQSCESSSDSDSPTVPWSAQLFISCFVISAVSRQLLPKAVHIQGQSLELTAQSWRWLCVHVYFKQEHKEVHTRYNYLQTQDAKTEFTFEVKNHKALKGAFKRTF